ncbi:MAG: response regulator [Planctomycetes bacterium]|nr:response regulator [Planctomycetota bacterium]
MTSMEVTKILIVDDEEILRTRTKKLLMLEDGFEVETAADGPQGLELFDQFQPHIVLLDIRMPGMDGIEVLCHIKERSTPAEVIMITGHGGVETAIDAMKKGAFGYLQKPVDFDELEIEIGKIVKKQHTQRQLAQYVKDIEQKKKDLDEQNQLLHKRTDELNDALAKLENTPKVLAMNRVVVLERIANDVAHELKNPLNSISSSLYYVTKQVPTELIDAKPKVKKHLDIISAQIERSKGIIENLRNFASPHLVDFQSVDLGEIIRKSVLLSLTDSGVKVEFDLDENLPLIEGSGHQLQQVFVNLCENAKRAMDNDGSIAISTKQQSGNKVLVTVRDSGTGIPDDIIDKIFDPFFSTKNEVEGVGLGLSICHGIVKKHGGILSVRNAPEGGAEFSMSLSMNTTEKQDVSSNPPLSQQ